MKSLNCSAHRQNCDKLFSHPPPHHRHFVVHLRAGNQCNSTKFPSYHKKYSRDKTCCTYILPHLLLLCLSHYLDALNDTTRLPSKNCWWREWFWIFYKWKIIYYPYRQSEDENGREKSCASTMKIKLLLERARIMCKALEMEISSWVIVEEKLSDCLRGWVFIEHSYA